MYFLGVKGLTTSSYIAYEYTTSGQRLLKNRSLPGDMEEGKNHTDHETRHTK